MFKGVGFYLGAVVNYAQNKSFGSNQHSLSKTIDTRSFFSLSSRECPKSSTLQGVNSCKMLHFERLSVARFESTQYLKTCPTACTETICNLIINWIFEPLSIYLQTEIK